MKRTIKKIIRFILYMSILSLIITIYVATLSSHKLQDNLYITERKNITFRIDGAFNSVERIQIENALRRWEEKTNNNVQLSASIGDVTFKDVFFWRSDGVPTIYKASSWWSWKYHVGLLLTNKDTWVTRAMALICPSDIFMMTDNDDFEDVVVHEVGHIIMDSSWHSKDFKSIMGISVGKAGQKKIMKEEIELIKKVK